MSGLDARFVVRLQGRDHVLYAGLLDLAHQRGLQSLEVTLVQQPTAENGNVAICSATATLREGDVAERLFTELGDASPANVNRMVANALIRMAATRAKARALRDAVNVGMVAVEELAEPEAEPRRPKTAPGSPELVERPAQSRPVSAPEPAVAGVILPTLTNPPAEGGSAPSGSAVAETAVRADDALTLWQDEVRRAARLGVTHKPLPTDATPALLTRWTAALRRANDATAAR